jgi:arginyl-tRNA synthetase
MLMKKAASLIAPYLILSPDELYPMFEYPPQKEMGDISLPCFTFAGQLKQAPQNSADQLAKQINTSQTDLFAQAMGG